MIQACDRRWIALSTSASTTMAGRNHSRFRMPGLISISSGMLLRERSHTSKESCSYINFYATSSIYVEKLCSIIERWNLTQYDVKAESTDSYYRVRKSWEDAKSQLGAYKVLANAKKCADKNPGYTVYNPNGKAVYPVNQEIEGQTFLVKVSIDDLNIRRGPGTNHDKVGVYTGRGVFTIVEVSSGQGSASGWGRLKSGAGWISLDYAERV